MPTDVTPLFHGELASLRRLVQKQRQQVQTIVVAYGWPASQAVVPIASGMPLVISKGVGVALARVAGSELAAGMVSKAVELLRPVGGSGHEGYFHLERTAALLQMLDDIQSSAVADVRCFFALSKGDGQPSVVLGGEVSDLLKVLLFVCARLFSESPSSRADVLATIKTASHGRLAGEVWSLGTFATNAGCQQGATLPRSPKTKTSPR